ARSIAFAIEPNVAKDKQPGLLLNVWREAGDVFEHGAFGSTSCNVEQKRCERAAQRAVERSIERRAWYWTTQEARHQPCGEIRFYFDRNGDRAIAAPEADYLSGRMGKHSDRRLPGPKLDFATQELRQRARNRFEIETRSELFR